LNLKEVCMQTQFNSIDPQSCSFPYAVIWSAGIALTLFCSVGIAALMGWIPDSMGSSSDKTVLNQQSANTAPVAVPAVAKAPLTVASHPAPMQYGAPVDTTVATCAECGVIESVREIKVKGQSSGLGAIGGGVLGGLLGNRVGAGRGKSAMTVVGAVGGAVAGNEVEKRAKTTTSYKVGVRMRDGSSRVIREASLPAWRTGDKVKVVNGAIQANA
jgi:outer membrane lipoprotein SlyB